MKTLNFKTALSAVAALAVLATVCISVFADVTSVARLQHGVAHGHSFAAIVTALGL